MKRLIRNSLVLLPYYVFLGATNYIFPRWVDIIFAAIAVVVGGRMFLGKGYGYSGNEIKDAEFRYTKTSVIYLYRARENRKFALCGLALIFYGVSAIFKSNPWVITGSSGKALSSTSSMSLGTYKPL